MTKKIIIIINIFFVLLLTSCQNRKNNIYLKEINVQKSLDYIIQNYNEKYNLKTRCEVRNLFGDSTFFVKNTFIKNNPFMLRLAYGECATIYNRDYTLEDNKTAMGNYSNELAHYQLEYFITRNGIKEKIYFHCQEAKVYFVKNGKTYRKLIQISSEGSNIDFLGKFYFED